MADDKKLESEQDNQAAPVKRRLRTNSETVRERTAKAQQQRSSDGTKKSNVFSAFGNGFLWPLRQIGRAFAKLGRFRVFRIIGRIFYPRYFRNSIAELRQVSWPDRLTTFRLTYAVIIFSVLFGAIVAVVDFGLDKLFKEFIIK
jgi:preprotein translocase SecE subunit